MNPRLRTRLMQWKDDVFRILHVGKRPVQPSDENELVVIELEDVANRNVTGDNQFKKSLSNEDSPGVHDNLSDKLRTGTGTDHVQTGRSRSVSCSRANSIIIEGDRMWHSLNPLSLLKGVSMIKTY